MKSLLSPGRLSGSIEPLEARIAPANVFIGDPNFNNALDTEYIELSSPAPSSLHFVNTSLTTGLPSQPEGSPTEAAPDAISQSLDGLGVGTYYMALKKGDQIFRFTDNSYQKLVRVTKGSAIAFFTDYDHDLEYDDGEFTGLSLGPRSKVSVSDKLFGDAVGNLTKDLDAQGTKIQVLDLVGLVNSKQGIGLLSVQGGSLFGKVLAGGSIAKLNVGGNVDGVYAGTAANGKTYDFFPGVPGGEGSVSGVTYGKNVKGASILNARVVSVTDGIFAGDGGFGAAGGDLKNIQVTQDTTGLKLIAGSAGDANAASGIRNGGAGGIVDKIYVAGVQDSTPNSAFNLQKVEIRAGDGGDGLINKTGGKGGFARNVFVGFELNGSSVISSGDLLGDSVLLQGGDGGDGRVGGKGGAVIGSKIRVQTPDAGGDEIAVIAGAGGDSLLSGGVAGAGGSIKKVDARNQILTFDSDLLVKAGDAGTTVGAGRGAQRWEHDERHRPRFRRAGARWQWVRREVRRSGWFHHDAASRSG